MQRFLRSSAFVICFSVAQAATIYNSIPGPLPPNMRSLGYQATQTAEFGELIQFAGTVRDLASVTVAMSDWAVAPADATGPTWNHPLTLNLYTVDNSGPVPVVGSLIASRTQLATIPWRPPADSTCTAPTAGGWRASDGNCYNGIAFTVDFDFAGVTVPNQIIYGLAFNTQTWGSSPIGTPGPYNSLNFALATTPPSVGSNPLPDSAFWNTSTAANYSTPGTPGTFRYDTEWTPDNAAISFDTVPEPGSLAFVTIGILGLLYRVRRSRLQ
jgi:hypothetical protein